MTEMMNCFSGVKHTDDNGDLPALTGNETLQEMLDYMVIVVSRFLGSHKAFKGGYMLNQLLTSDSRQTRDIDFSIGNKDDYEDVKEILKKIADNFVENGLISRYKIKEEIKETMSGGIDFYDESGAKVLGVDVGLHDISWGIKSYSFDVCTIDGFEIERMLSDKTIAILSRKRFRRTKDLYDFFIITSAFDFDYQKLRRFIDMRGGAEWDNIPFNDDVLREYRKAWDKLVLKDYRGNALNKPDFNDVILRFYSIALPMKANEIRNKWNHNILNFER